MFELILLLAGNEANFATFDPELVKAAYDNPTPDGDVLISNFVIKLVKSVNMQPGSVGQAFRNWGPESQVNTVIHATDEAYALYLLENYYPIFTRMKNIQPSSPTKQDRMTIFMQNNKDNKAMMESALPRFNKRLVQVADGSWTYVSVTGHGYGSCSLEGAEFYGNYLQGAISRHRRSRERNAAFAKTFGAGVHAVYPEGGYNTVTGQWVRAVPNARRGQAANIAVNQPQPMIFEAEGLEDFLQAVGGGAVGGNGGGNGNEDNDDEGEDV